MDLATAKTNLAQLETALVSGVRTVTINGRETTYQSLEHIQTVAAELRRSIAIAEGRSRYRVFTNSGTK